MTTKPTLTNLLREAARDELAQGASIRGLARQAGIAYPQLWHFLRGSRSLTLPTAERLIELFGIRHVRPNRRRKRKRG